MDFKFHLERGWKTVWNFIGAMLLLTVVQLAVSVLSLGLLAPVTAAGYVHSMLLALRDGRVPEVRDLFSQMSLFLPLFLFGLCATVLIGLGFFMLVLPGMILVIAFAFSCLYMLPLMTDKQLMLVDAMKKSWEVAKREPVSDQIITTIIYLGIYAVGSSIPFGIVIAQPVATAIILSVYEERIGMVMSNVEKHKEKEEMG